MKPSGFSVQSVACYRLRDYEIGRGIVEAVETPKVGGPELSRFLDKLPEIRAICFFGKLGFATVRSSQGGGSGGSGQFFGKDRG